MKLSHLLTLSLLWIARTGQGETTFCRDTFGNRQGGNGTTIRKDANGNHVINDEDGNSKSSRKDMFGNLDCD